MNCKYCNSENLYQEQKSIHIGLYCKDCGRFQKWIKQDTNIDSGEVATDKQQIYAMSLMRKYVSLNKTLTLKQAGTIIQLLKD